LRGNPPTLFAARTRDPRRFLFQIALVFHRGLDAREIQLGRPRIDFELDLACLHEVRKSYVGLSERVCCHGWLSATTNRAFPQAGGIASESIAPRLEPLPLHIVDETHLTTSRRQPKICVVDAEEKPVLGP